MTRPKLGWTGSLPVRYGDTIRELPGVKQACGSLWAGLKVPGKEDVFFGSMGIEAEPFIAMHDEIEAPEEQKRAWLSDERGAFVSVALAKQLGWKLGDRVVFESRQYPGKWEANVSAIFRSTREGFGERMRILCVSLLVGAGMGVLGGLLPALGAARVSPIQAMRV